MRKQPTLTDSRTFRMRTERIETFSFASVTTPPVHIANALLDASARAKFDRAQAINQDERFGPGEMRSWSRPGVSERASR